MLTPREQRELESMSRTIRPLAGRRWRGRGGADGLAPAAAAEEVNLYSSRHYDTDVALYERFTAETGIEVNLIEGDADQLIERIKAEGRTARPTC